MDAIAQTGQISGLLAGAVVIAAMAGCAAMIAMLRPLLIRYAMARPNARSSHRVPTPQGGGIAVIVATLGVSVLVFLLGAGWNTETLALVIPVFTATMVLAVLGAIDDIRALPVGLRILVQVIAVATMVGALSPEMQIVPYLPWVAERALMVVTGVWFVNLVNFMDGIDWMTVAEFVPLSGGLILLGYLGVLPAYAVVVALAMLGAILGFAPFNRPVARLFLGDVGSLPIGLVTGWLLFLLAGNGQIAAAIILSLYYTSDATLTLMRRLIEGERVWIAHRSHFYQRATGRGFSVLEVVTRVFVVNCLLVALAIVSVLGTSRISGIVALALACAAVSWLLTVFARGRLPQEQASTR